MAGVPVKGGDGAAFKVIARVEVELGGAVEPAAEGQGRGRQAEGGKAAIEDGEPADCRAMGDLAFAREGLLIENLAGARGGGVREALELVAVADLDEGGEVVVEIGAGGGPGRVGGGRGDGRGDKVAEHGERERRAPFEFGRGGRVELEGGYR